MRKLPLIGVLVAVCICGFAQDYSTDRTTLANFLKRMYNQTAFEGVKIVEDYDAQYFISVLSLDKSRYQTSNALFRVANVKALRQASEFVNGGKITSDLVIRTTEVKEAAGAITVSEETIEKIHSVGFVQGMELLINFASADDTQMVFIYLREIGATK
jgi:hypothetical protein